MNPTVRRWSSKRTGWRRRLQMNPLWSIQRSGADRRATRRTKSRSERRTRRASVVHAEALMVSESPRRENHIPFLKIAKVKVDDAFKCSQRWEVATCRLMWKCTETQSGLEGC